MSQRLMKDKLSLSLSITEPFRSNLKYTIDYLDTTFKSHSVSTQYVRSANVSAYWRFGKFNASVKKVRKSSADDKMEGGGNTSNQVR